LHEAICVATVVELDPAAYYLYVLLRHRLPPPLPRSGA